MALADLLDPRLVLQRDLNAVSEGSAVAKTRKPKRRTRALSLPTHIVIPDTQIKPGVDTSHLDWIGSYVADSFGDRDNVKIIILGDWWDMPSLSSYDVGTARLEGARVADDIRVGNEAFSRFDSLIPKKKTWEYHFLFGNHEERVLRAVNADARLEGLLGLHLMDTKAWQRHQFKEVVWLDGVAYSHYFYNQDSGRPYGGKSMDTRLKTVGHSFTQGHTQGLMFGTRSTLAGTHQGISAGSCYTHDEHYRGPQAQDHWRGIVVCNEVEDGSYSFMDITLDYFARRYEGMRLSEFLAKQAA